MHQSPLVDPELFGRLSGVSIRFDGHVEGAVAGSHRSRARGSSVEFAQYREYAPGDEIKHIDWKSYARNDRFYVKQFEDETDLRTLFVVDTSNSMAFKMGDCPEKITYAGQLAAALAWTLIQQGDAIGLLTHGAEIGTYLPPRNRPEHFWRFVRNLESAQCQGETNLAAALTHVANLPLKRSNIVLLSDCLEFSENFIGLLKQLRRKHYVSVLHILDPSEIQFPFSDLTIFEDAEDSSEQQVDPRAMAEEYRLAISRWVEGLEKGLADGQVNYKLSTTDTAIEKSVMTWARGRRK
ncbi:MAG: DUF58 domain-containing protein [Myxococcales bacterium]|nr:DUF58 domain-containing protein [Myxococcales bacterium]